MAEKKSTKCEGEIHVEWFELGGRSYTLSRYHPPFVFIIRHSPFLVIVHHSWVIIRQFSLSCLQEPEYRSRTCQNQARNASATYRCAMSGEGKESKVMRLDITYQMGFLRLRP